MKSKMPEEAVRQMLETLYMQRAERLEDLCLAHIIPRNPSVFWSLDSLSAAEIVKNLLEAYLAECEDWWRELTQDSDFCAKAIRVNQRITTQKFLYEEEFAKARNRITFDFIHEYSTEEFDIDWEKLVRFNSGAD